MYRLKFIIDHQNVFTENIKDERAWFYERTVTKKSLINICK